MAMKEKNSQQIKYIYYGLYLIILLLILIILYYYFFRLPAKSLQEQVLPTISLYSTQKAINLPLIDDKQQTLDLQTVAKNKWLLLYFGYTSCPDICPVDMAIIAKAFRGMKHQTKMQVIFISVDAKNDLGKLTNYVQRFHTDFIGATLMGSQLASTAKALGVYYQVVTTQEMAKQQNHQHHKKPNKLINHTTSYLLLNPKHALVGVLSSPHNENQIMTALDQVIAYKN